MSSPRSLSPTSPAVRGLPRGEVIGRYGTYADAQKAVDRLADEQFEVNRIAIVGNDLKSVEQVTGRLSYPRVAGQGALNGLVFGAFLGIIMSLLGGEQWMSSLLVSMLLGGAFWMLLATVGYATQRGKRDFTSTNQIVATSYDVVAAPEVARRARQVLQQGPGRARTPGPAPAARPGPPRERPQSAPPAGPGAPWQRPSYGTGADPAPGAPAAADTGAQEDPGRSALFQDLPDGRPQYGIRLPDAQRPAPDAARPPAADRGAGQQTPGEEPDGSTSAGAPR